MSAFDPKRTSAYLFCRDAVHGCRMVMQHPTGGVVGQLYVHDGDHVTAGQLLIRLDETASRADLEIVRKALTGLYGTDIWAPQDGIVFQSTANTIGGVIAAGTAGDPIMLIVPESDQLTVEVKIDPKDIEQIRLGQPAVLRFSAFSLRTTPEVNGTVSRIAADTSTDQRTGQSYYLVRIAMRVAAVGDLGELKVTPGMPVEAFIQTGERTLLSYLVKPLHDQLLQAYRQN